MQYNLILKIFVTGILLGSAALTGSAESLKEVYAQDFLIGNVAGTGTSYSTMRKDPIELEVLVREFNCLTAENLMKSEYLQPEPGQFNFVGTDEFVAFAEQHNMNVVGHALVWHSQVPSWLFVDEQGQLVSREVMIERMRDHIHTVVGRYKGRIQYWDVVNEAVETEMVVDESLPLDEEGNPQLKRVAFYRDSLWRQIIGDDYIELAFKFAHEADPEAHLLYNDYSMNLIEKAEFVADMVRGLKAKGTPIHGVGMQGHWHLDYDLAEDLQSAIDTYVAAGVKVSVTELDIGVLPSELNPYTNGVPAEVLQQQADKYQEIFEVMLRNREHIERVSFWGVTDKYSWRNNWPVNGRTDAPLLFDRSFEPKPAYDVLIQRPEASSNAVDFDGSDITTARYVWETGYPLNTIDISLGAANQTGQPIYDGFNRISGGGNSDLSSATITYEDQTWGQGGIRLQWNGDDPQTGLWDEGDVSTAIFMFKQEDFLNGLDAGTVCMDAAHDTLSASVVFNPNDPARLTSTRLRWVVGDAGQYYISDAEIITSAGNYQLTAEATEILWYNYDPEADITVVLDAAFPTLQDIDFLGFQLEATCGANIPERVYHHVMVSAFTAEATKKIVTPTSLYNDWISDYPGVGSNDGMLDHADSDPFDNLSEYAFDGIPTDGNDPGNEPVISQVTDAGSDYIQYVYYERHDAADRWLSSLLWVGTNLVSGDWVDGSSYEVGRGSSIEPGFTAVTNWIPIDAATEKFIRLQIQFTP